MQRHGSVLKIRPEKLEEYKLYHKSVWPEVLEMIKKCNIRNYSIYHKDGYLFSYFEYLGDDFEGDIERMSDHPRTQEWWRHTDPCQQPVPSAGEGEWWAPAEEVFHTD